MPQDNEMIRIYSRDRLRHAVILLEEDGEFGDLVETTKYVEGHNYLDWPKNLLGWDVGNKIKAGILRVCLAPTE